MARKVRYPVAEMVGKVSAALKIEPVHVLRRAGLPDDYLTNEDRGVDAKQFFALWSAFFAETKREDLALHMGQTFAHGPFTSAVFAFSCSPNVETGLKRLALFKPLVGPFALKFDDTDAHFAISISSADPECQMPDVMAPFELVYFLELCRSCTIHHIVPLRVEIPGEPIGRNELDAFFGVTSQRSEAIKLVLSREDAERPLLSANPELWAGFEGSLQRKLADRTQSDRMSVRVKSALLELLPSGQSSVEEVCGRLHVSKRSLQRHLKSEGQSFQSLLDSTRTELSLNYLSRGDLSVEEISYLLAYRDPNSFYRAFQGWTGMTPAEARGQRQH